MPKYIGPTPRPASLLARFGSGRVPTLTEDILSAMKIGKAGHLGMPILGTSLSNAYRVELLRIGECNVWTDPDAAGRKAATKIIRQLSGWGVACRNIVSARDPKKHTIDEIKEYLR